MISTITEFFDIFLYIYEFWPKRDGIVLKA